MSFTRRHMLLMSTATAGLAFSPNVYANIPAPRFKPVAPNLSQYLSDNDARNFRNALAEARNRKWPNFAALRRRVEDPTARDVLTWVQATNDTDASFTDLTYVAHNLSDWPRMVRVKARAEQELFDNPITPQRTIEWFRGLDPVSGEGRAALARAHYALGNTAEGDRWLKFAWRESKLTRDRQKDLFGAYRNRLNAEDHAVRADYLIWEGRGHFSKARALIPHMSSTDGAIMSARIAIALGSNGMDAAVNRVPENRQNDIGLLFERARWRRRKRSKEDALSVHREMLQAPVTSQGQHRLWIEKKIMIYWAIEEKRFFDAYNLSLNHGSTSGVEFAEAEFLAGWLSLVKLNKADQAIPHFTRLANGVTYPVSLARGYYWLGRAYEAAGTGQEYYYYQQAAKYENTFYGQLAGEKIGGDGQIISLPTEPDPTFLSAEFESDRRVRAMRLIGETREDRYFNQFSFHLDDELKTQSHLTLLSNLAQEYGYIRPSVRAAKQASRFQSMQTETGYPIPDPIITLPSNTFDIPFVLSIARQESEFDNQVVSSARAYGMMQMINATARTTARKHGIPYNRSRLLTDVDYSARLGALHLNDLLERFSGSYIMTAAAYNAGPSRVSQWIRAYGDPRSPDVDTIDWMESIPFTETRNYVQRVLENLQVYRARLNNNSALNQICQNINR